MIAYIFLLVCAFDMCNTMYPCETDIVLSYLKSKLINLSYYSIYYFSCGQILFSKLKTKYGPMLKIVGNTFNKFLTDNHIINPNSIQNPASLILDFYLNGQNTQQIDVLYTYNNVAFSNLEVCWPEDTKKATAYDFIIASYKECGQNCTNKLHYKTFPTQFDYSKCYIRFLSMELTYENTVYPIKLEADYYNHYYMGNVIDSHFFKYYLTNVLNLNIDLNADNFDYSVSLIDQDVNILTLTSKQYIILEKNSYKIFENNDTLEDESLKNEDTEYVTLENINY